MFPQVCLFILLFIKCYGYQDSCCSDNNRYRIPEDVMIDVVNNLALKLLAIHSEGNDNNIAISPYGVVSVLVALKEGVRGSAASEIHRATGIPSDLSVVRIGLRDIHRHLKSYFIPEEGFLSGLTLSHDNVTLNREYEDILKFYGFDLNSFNNVLYPDFSTTEGFTSTTEEVSTTTEIGTSTAEMLVSTTEQSATTENISEKEQQAETTSTMISTIENVQTTTEGTTEQSATTENISEKEQQVETTSTIISTIENVQTTTEGIRVTRSERPSTVTETVSTTTVAATTTHSEMLLSTNGITSTTIEETTTPESTEASTTLASETTSYSGTLTTLPEEKSSTTSSQMLTETTSIQTTLETSSIPSQTSTLSLTSTETTEISSTTEEKSTETSTENKIDSEEFSEISSTVQMSTTEVLDSSDSSDLNDGSEEESATEMSTRSTTIDSTTNTIQLNDETTKYSDESKNNDTLRRNTRSVVDYIIARYYDDHVITQRPPPYNSENDLYFLVNDKYKETNINYMTYDTVLPFHYISHLNTLALRFPLDSSKYYLLLLLPENPKQLNRLICDIRLNSSLKYVIDNLRYTHVKAIIPSFMLKGYVILTSTFQKMGINRVFEPRQADFSPMTSDRGVYVTNIEQAITVNIRNYVDPDTMNNNRYLHRTNPVLFKADHPFLYFVIDSEIDVTLMAGKIVNPLNSRIR